MKWSFADIVALALCLQPLSALPAKSNRAAHQVLKTTTTSDGQIIDWVLRDTQGEIATPPPVPARMLEASNATQPDIEAMVAADPSLRGPEGTVPIARKNAYTSAKKALPHLSQASSEGGLETRAGYAGSHWYASSAQAVNNIGSTGTTSMFKAYVETGGDFSLLQTAVIRYNVPTSGGSTTSQTLEAGWINYPNQVSAPHLFTYFTTVGYSSEGDNIGGWNRDHAGWVQYDSTIYPGFAFSQISTDGGDQYDFNIEYLLSGGNWWYVSRFYA
jgi:hypothetical protein